MLLPDSIHPKDSIYYNGAIILRTLQDLKSSTVVQLYSKIRMQHEMTFPVMLLSLDWLYLINVAVVNKKGEIELCSSNR